MPINRTIFADRKYLIDQLSQKNKMLAERLSMFEHLYLSGFTNFLAHRMASKMKGTTYENHNVAHNLLLGIMQDIESELEDAVNNFEKHLNSKEDVNETTQ